MYTAKEIKRKQEESIEQKKYVQDITNQIYEFVSKIENFDKKEFILKERAITDATKNLLIHLGYSVEIKQIGEIFCTIISW